MKRHDIDPILEKVSEEIADFTVGFVKLSAYKGIEDAEPAGSGSLVRVGSINGILTAAHVIRNLPDQGEVGLVQFPRVQRFAQKLTIDVGQTESLILADNGAGPKGPDLGFLRLPLTDVQAIEARNVFFNIGKRRDSILSGDHPDPPYFDGISGMIAEWTMDLPPERRLARVKGFRALYGVGVVVKKHGSNGFDLLDFEVTYGPGSDSPLSYEGMSGGALWRVYCTKDEDGQLSVSDKKVFGVAFYQSELSDQKRIITCHGPKSVYGPLIEAIREKWQE